MPDFAELFPERFNNKTNGVTPRRWLLLANPDLAKLLTDAVGDGWVTDLAQLKQGRPAGRRRRRSATSSWRPSGRRRRGSWTGSRPTTGIALDPDTLFDVQIKRIHEYKRQLLNVLQVRGLVQPAAREPEAGRAAADVPVRRQGGPGVPPREAHHQADQRASAAWSTTTRRSAASSGSSSCRTTPCTLAEHLIPASDVSEQISTAGYEASGTSNMKFMMNGALTVGTRDGANIEIAEEAGEENVLHVRPDRRAGARRPRLVQPALALRERAGDASRPGPDLRQPLQPRTSPASSSRSARRLLTKGDYYMHLADLTGYVRDAAEGVPPCTRTGRRGRRRRSTTSPGPGSSRATGRSASTRGTSGAPSRARSR